MENKAKRVVEYYVMCNKLKDVVRTGWKNWNVERKRVESIAEHIFGVQSLAIAMWSQYEYDLDFKKVIFMLAVHELEEIIIGDLTQFDISREEKMKKGIVAVDKVLDGMLKKEEIRSLISEFDERKTNEAIFAFQCDKLECDIQCKLYDEESCVDLNNQVNNMSYYDENVQELLKTGKSWSSMWLSFGRDRYNYDSNFSEVSFYVENNKINRNISDI